MYLFTLVFIFLTVIGIFTEIVTLQNARFAAMKTGGAQQLLTWHSAVVSAARYTVGGTPAFNNPARPPAERWGVAAPCTVLAFAQPANAGNMPAPCPGRTLQPARLNALVVAPGQTVNMLPNGYNAALTFNSIILTETGGTGARLAVTFIGPAATASDPVALLGLSTSQLYRQLLRQGVERTGFGYIVNNQLQPAAAPSTTVNNITTTVTGIYTLPAALVFNAATNPAGPIRSGALALFTPL